MNEDKNAETEEYIAVEDFTGSGAEQLSFTAGEKILVHDKSSVEWWWAELAGIFGYVPSTYLHQVSESEEDSWQDEEYFGSYSTLKLHLEMLSDKPRTETYRQVMVSNSAALRGKVVMDLGCGTGIISLFCARLAQPAAVFAVEASSVAEHTEKLVKLNGCEGTVRVYRSKAEELMLPSKVDVLVSEWMGNCLLFEFMVESVLCARDRWLKDGGVMWPSSATLSLVPCQAHAEYSQKMQFWENLYDLDFSCLQPVAQQEFFSKPKFSHDLNPQDCLSSPCEVVMLDMLTVTVSELEKLSGDFSFSIDRCGTLHAFTAWFSTFFQSLNEDGVTLELNTGPFSESTHWKQTLFMLDAPVGVEEGDRVIGSVVLRRNPLWRRHMTIAIRWRIASKNGAACSEVQTKCFPMWR